MPGFTIAGVVIALIGTLLMMPEIFWGYAGIFANVVEQAKEETWIKHQRFFSLEEDKAKAKEEKYKSRIHKWKIMRTVGLIILIIGLMLQILGL